ncbi:hypothetical protein N7U49_08690 [Streptomyces sp. AD2-2]|nr:hypothetical protein N7U49_08690 [Streptomyces sp. AD2-2]
MLRIIDVRTGEPVEAAPARRGLTRVQAHASGLDATALRVLLTSDLLVRALELGGTPVWSLLTGDRQQAELRSAANALGIRPFEDGTDLGSGLGEAQVLHVMAGGAETAGESRSPKRRGNPGLRGDRAGRGRRGPRRFAHGGRPRPLRTGRAPARAALAPRDLPVRLDGEALDEARRTLAHWRGAVADWARRPSRPVPDDVRVELRTAWEDDLNVPEVLRVLHRVETWPDLPDGARFETYAYADRLLGLELTRDIGSLA